MSEYRVLKNDADPEDTVKDMLQYFIDSGTAGSVFALRKTRQEGRYCYSLISETSLLSEILPFFPVMPVQGARALSELTITEPLDQPVVALLRPCEIRAFVENVKQSQGHLENIFIISCTCSGVIPAKKLFENNRDSTIDNLDENLRNSCKACTEFVPGPQADMTVLLAADEQHEGTVIYLQTDRALEVAEKFESNVSGEYPAAEELTTDLLETRKAALTELLRNTPSVENGLQSMVSIFSSCTGCRGCREACPVCTCILCDYETARTIHSPELIRTDAEMRGSLRVPTGTLQFQLGRLMHISPHCVSCGQCSDVCPVEIPVADIFIRAATLVQESLEYSPGRDIDDAPPMATYREKELQDITD